MVVIVAVTLTSSLFCFRSWLSRCLSCNDSSCIYMIEAACVSHV